MAKESTNAAKSTAMPAEEEGEGFCSAAVDAAVALLRRRLCGSTSTLLLPHSQTNRRKLLEGLTSTIKQRCSTSMLLIGPRGCGKSLVLDQVLLELQKSYPDRVSVVRLNGFLHANDRCAMKEIAKQMCMEHALTFTKGASFEENLHFLTSVLRECARAHRTILFVLDEFDLFAQRSKQSLLYNLLDLMQSLSSQAALIGVSSRLDADQLLEKRVRSRFSHCKLLFLPPSTDEILSLYNSLLCLPESKTSFWREFDKLFKENTSVILQQASVKQLVDEFMSVEVSGQRCVDLLFRVLCEVNRLSGNLSPSNFKVASANLAQQPKLEILSDLSVLELCLLVSMNRLEAREAESYNFNTVFKEYKRLEEHNTCDVYSKQCALRAFEHLLEREVITFKDSFGPTNMLEVRPVKLLVSSYEIDKGLEANLYCPTILRQWRAFEAFK